MEPSLIGYFPKRRQPVPDWFQNATIRQICSVSECIVPGPTDWIAKWRHNALFLFDSPTLARSVLRAEELDDFDVFEYRAFPFRFDRHVRTPWDLSVVAPEQLAHDCLTILGYDLVSRSTDSAFECSPLSCNAMADEWTTNEFCLIDDAATAIDYADRLCDAKAEPGPYCVIRVSLVAPH